MSWIRSIGERFKALFGKGALDSEMDEELRFHIEMETEKNLRRGMGPDEAKRKAMVDFGGVERFREQAREERGIRPMEDLVQDARYALRQLRKNPGFAFVAILTLALGIGATTTIFSVVNALILNPLDFHEPDRLVSIWNQKSLSKSFYSQLREEAQTLEGLEAHHDQTFVLLEGGEPEELLGGIVSTNHFSFLGVQPALGRGFTEEEEEPGQGQVVVLSHRVWERRYGSDPGIIGREVSIGEGGGTLRTVVGVMPEGYRSVTEGWDLWIPFQIDPSNFPDYEGNASLRFLGRVRDGVEIAQANTEIHELVGRLTADWDFITPEERAAAGIIPLKEQMLGEVGFRLWVLLGSVGLVLLLACINVANLLLAKGQSRAKELGVRLAMGAGRGRVVRQLLTEAGVLGVLGGGLGLLIANLSLPALVGILPPGIPRTDLISLDQRVLFFTLFASILSALVFGLFPAFQATGKDLQLSLKEGGVGRSAGRGKDKLRNGLVVLELAVAVILVVGAGLLFRSFWRLQSLDPGFDPQHVVTMRMSLPGDRYPDEASRLPVFQDMVGRIEGLNGVTSAGLTNFLPMVGGGMSVQYTSDDSSVPEEDLPNYTNIKAVSTRFFSTLGVPLHGGQWVDFAQSEDPEWSVLVNRTMALSLWPDGEDPVGKTVNLPFGLEFPPRIVGVVEDFAQRTLSGEVQPEVYVSEEYWAPARMYLVARVSGDPEGMNQAIQTAIWDVDGEIPITRVRTMEQVVSRTLASSRLTTLLLLLFGALALTLGAVGVYGVASYAVSQSTFEIGVRMALGAGSNEVLGQVLRRFLTLASIGILVGLAGAFAASRVLAGLLYQISATDPLTFLGVALTLGLVALGAVSIPAFRASRIQPAQVLKQE
jgi:putative ABC transport system permease protein